MDMYPCVVMHFSDTGFYYRKVFSTFAGGCEEFLRMGYTDQAPDMDNGWRVFSFPGGPVVAVKALPW